ncbi:MAG: cell division protein FtsA [Rhodobiaceae bacterium]|nr:cell division protein FtsA [Rhodobiaceae bacterium]MCC0040863.1 cell division protein FtsA [Rhodobiaceae bacterium]MCC0053689.1 cell division protein FtsA [Rhodobiaceae bacterium]
MRKPALRIPRLEPLKPTRSHTLAVLDVGSSKICCLIAKLRPCVPGEGFGARTHQIEILGFGLQRARGVKRGVIVDMDLAERGIRLAVESAEKMAGVTVESVIVATAAGRITSEAFQASVPIPSREVGEFDVSRVMGACAAQADTSERTPLHVLPVGFTIDGQDMVRDPRGMVGDRLSVDMHVVSAHAAALRNVLICVERCHLGVETLVATPYASGLAALVPDEIELGAAMIDMGAGTTSIGIFCDGRFHFADVVAVGGHHVTLDLARGLGTTVEAAERIKALYGSAISAPSDTRDLITVPPVDGREGHDIPAQVPRSFVTDIIKARVEEIFELVRDRLAANGFAGIAAQRLVLTGGASQLAGTAEVAERILGARVRLGRPLGVQGLPESARGPGFAASCGLLVYPQVAAEEDQRSEPGFLGLTGTDGYLVRVGQWIRESF